MTFPDGVRRNHDPAHYGTIDNTGAHRMLSSRRAADGPTFGDLGGSYSLTFRSAKRL